MADRIRSACSSGCRWLIAQSFHFKSTVLCLCVRNFGPGLGILRPIGQPWPCDALEGLRWQLVQSRSYQSAICLPTSAICMCRYTVHCLRVLYGGLVYRERERVHPQKRERERTSRKSDFFLEQKCEKEWWGHRVWRWCAESEPTVLAGLGHGSAGAHTHRSTELSFLSSQLILPTISYLSQEKKKKKKMVVADFYSQNKSSVFGIITLYEWYLQPCKFDGCVHHRMQRPEVLAVWHQIYIYN